MPGAGHGPTAMTDPLRLTRKCRPRTRKHEPHGRQENSSRDALPRPAPLPCTLRRRSGDAETVPSEFESVSVPADCLLRPRQGHTQARLSRSAFIGPLMRVMTPAGAVITASKEGRGRRRDASLRSASGTRHTPPHGAWRGTGRQDGDSGCVGGLTSPPPPPPQLGTETAARNERVERRNCAAESRSRQRTIIRRMSGRQAADGYERETRGKQPTWITTSGPRRILQNFRHERTPPPPLLCWFPLRTARQTRAELSNYCSAILRVADR